MIAKISGEDTISLTDFIGRNQSSILEPHFPQRSKGNAGTAGRKLLFK